MNKDIEAHFIMIINHFSFNRTDIEKKKEDEIKRIDLLFILLVNLICSNPFILFSSNTMDFTSSLPSTISEVVNLKPPAALLNTSEELEN